MHDDRTEYEKLEQRIDAALDIVADVGRTDGAHHKQWGLDQIARTLLDDDAAYEAWRRTFIEYGQEDTACNGWDEGVAP